MSQPAGKEATVEFRFRNGRRVRFEAHVLLVDKLLGDVKQYIASSPPQLDWQKIDVNDIGSRLVTLNQQQYLGPLVAHWELELEPAAGHLDRRITVSTPLQSAGAFLLTAQMDQGNASHITVCLDDTLIVKKTMADNAYYFIADSRTGQPIARADVELFGWRMGQVAGKNEYRTETRSLSSRADDLGQVVISTKSLTDGLGAFQWVCTARTLHGRFAYLGFAPIWRGGYHDPAYDQIKVFSITDRPVYRPGQPVRFKFWVAHARYNQPDSADFANKTFTVEIHNPKGEKVLTHDFEADRFGGFDGVFELPTDAALGVYQVLVARFGGGTFRVEEYKKPEFEVKIESPTKPVMLGEKVPATIKARYYFGSPVGKAKVKYKITRTTADEALVSGVPMGLAVRAGSLVVRRGFVVVSRVVAVGCRPAAALVVGWFSAPAGDHRSGRNADPAGRHLSHRDRHLFGQRVTSRYGSPLRDHGRGDRRVAPHHRGHGNRAGGP